jgi:hypothetical protein
MEPMSREKFNARVAELLAEEATQPMRWIYLSFAGTEGWRGAIIVEAQGITSALILCNTLGINPHGEVLGRDVPDGVTVKADYCYRLLDKEEAEAAFTRDPVN